MELSKANDWGGRQDDSPAPLTLKQTHTHTHTTTTENNCSGFSPAFGFLWPQLWKSSVGKAEQNGENMRFG